MALALYIFQMVFKQEDGVLFKQETNKQEEIDDFKFFKNPNLRIRHVNINMCLTDGLIGAVFNVLLFYNFLLRISMCNCI